MLGKGFAVVADEVRNRAHSSAESAQRMAKLLVEVSVKNATTCFLKNASNSIFRKKACGGIWKPASLEHVSTPDLVWASKDWLCMLQE